MQCKIVNFDMKFELVIAAEFRKRKKSVSVKNLEHNVKRYFINGNTAEEAQNLSWLPSLTENLMLYQYTQQFYPVSSSQN